MNTNTRILRNPAEVLTAIPELCGYIPVESLIVLPFSEQFGGALMRIDLPTDNRHNELFAAAVVANLVRFCDISRVVLAVFTSEPMGLGRPPRTDLIKAIVAACDATAIDVASALLHAGDGWCEYGGKQGGTIESLQHDERQLATSPTELLRIEPATVAARDSLRALLETIDEVMPRLHPFELLETWNDLEFAPADDESDDFVLRLAIVVSGLRSVALTGILLHHIGYGAEAVNELLAVHILGGSASRYATSAEPGDAVLERWWSTDFECRPDMNRDAEEPSDEPAWSSASEFVQAAIDRVALEAVDLDRCERAIRLLRRIAGYVTGRRGADVLAVLAWTHWAMGNLSAADHYSEQALQLTRVHLLANEVADLCARAIVPGWIGSTGCSGGVRDADLHDLIDSERQ